MSNENMVLVVDNDLRTIKIPVGMTNIGVVGDKEVKRLYFRMPRYYGGFDLSFFTIRINHFNAAGEGDIYLVDDVSVGYDIMSFSWQVGEHMTAYPGKVHFNIAVERSHGTTIEKAFKTTNAYTRVLESSDPIKQIVNKLPGIVESLKGELFKRFDGRIDSSLLVSGMAADAAITGKKLRHLETSISNPYRFRGVTTYAKLPTSGNSINDTYYCSDVKCKYTWNGSGWYQSSLNETDYLNDFVSVNEAFDSHFVPVAVQPNRVYKDVIIITDGSFRAQVGGIVKELALIPGESYYVTKLNSGRNSTHFYDADFNSVSSYTGLYSAYERICVIPDNVHYVRFTVEDGYTGLFIPVSKYNMYGEVDKLVAPTVCVEKANSADKLTSPLNIDLTTFNNKYMVYNMHNPDSIAQEGVYCNYKDGTLAANADYCITDKISVMPGQKLVFLDEESNPVSVRMVASFGSEGNHIGGAQNVTEYTQTGDEDYIIVSLRIATEKNITICDGAGYQYMPYGSAPYMNPKYIKNGNMYLRDSCRVAHSEVLPNTKITLSEFPRYLKNSQEFSFSGNFESFAGLLIGKGYNEYRGHWFYIDGTRIVHHSYENSDSIVETVDHELTIDKYISISIDVKGHDCAVNINTMSGTFSHIFNWACEACGEPFVKFTNMMTDVVFSGTSTKFEKKMWMFGDSYFGVTDERVIGQLKNLGYFNDILVNGLAGQGSSGAYSDLLRCLDFGHPTYLVWCLGMNDDEASYSKYLPKLIDLCNTKGINLIVAKIPTVPNKNKEGINAIVDESGLRYVDFYSAVGANSAGAWRDGYLSGDRVHPTELGAKALAMRLLIDVPEIMRY